MAFLDFIKNRNQQQSVAQTTQQQKPETAKAMFMRQDAQDRAELKPITQDIKAQADKVRALETLNKATQHMDAGPRNSAPENADSPAANVQNQNHQDRTQTALSPTDGASGKSPSQEKPKAPEKAPERSRTLPRPRPSWER